MPILRLKANTPEEERILAYLQENASEELQTKIEVGAIIQIGEKYLLNLKDLSGFMKYAHEEARKLLEKGGNAVCVSQEVVFGWATHYFEEDSIHGTLYNEDGSLYNPAPKKSTPATKPVKDKPRKKAEEVPDNQPSFFDFEDLMPIEPSAEEAEEPVQDTTPMEEPSAPEEKKPTLWERYQAIQEEYQTYYIVMRVGDFYEVYGDDVDELAAHLNLTVVKRQFSESISIPMIGFPVMTR